MQHIHVNNGNTFLLVEIPEDAQGIGIGRWCGRWLTYKTSKQLRFENPHEILLRHSNEDGEFTIISKADAITEEQAKEIVQLHHIAPLSYEHYEFRVIALYSAKESLQSLLRSHSLQPETTLILKKR